MANLTPSQILGYASGVTCQDPQTAGAIAWAESHGNPNNRCLNCVPGVAEDSRGLWQINVRANPQYRSLDLYNPAVNAQVMSEMSRGCTYWRPWSTAGPSTGYAYRRYLPLFASSGNPPDTGSLPASEPTTDTTTVDTSPAPPIDLGPITSDLGAFPGGIPMWLAVVAIGVAAWLIIR